MPKIRDRGIVGAAAALLIAATACSNHDQTSAAPTTGGNGDTAATSVVAATGSAVAQSSSVPSSVSSASHLGFSSSSVASAPSGSVSQTEPTTVRLPSMTGQTRGNMLHAALGAISLSALPAHSHLYFSAPGRLRWTTDVQVNRKLKSRAPWSYGLAGDDKLFGVWTGMPKSPYTLREWTGEDLPWAITMADDAANSAGYNDPRTVLTVLGDDTHWAAVAKGYIADARELKITDIKTTGDPDLPELIDASGDQYAGLVRPTSVAAQKHGWIAFARSRSDLDNVGAGGSLADDKPIADLADCLDDQDAADIQSSFEPETGVAIGLRSTEQDDVLTVCLLPYERTPRQAAEVALTVLETGVTGKGKAWSSFNYRSVSAAVLANGTAKVTLLFQSDETDVGSQAGPAMGWMLGGDVPGSFNTPACSAIAETNPISRQKILDRLHCRR